jgi:predicted ATPase/DNA-binding CsgD family transcriptional regulator
VGKTRLALRAAETVAGDFTAGLVFVALASLSDPALVLPAISHAFGLQDGSGQPLGEALRAALRARRLLLLLDNFEHLTPAAPAVVDLLATCPTLTSLVTSRAALRVQAEHTYPVAPLTPPTPEPPTAESLADNAAVRLFAQRAAAVRPAFVVTDENAAKVAEICRRLDGLPLAIELAAARMKLLTPAALLDRLEHRLVLLSGGLQDAPARQRTMYAAIAWSHDLLTLDEQALLRRLAVFAGGFTLEAAEAVGQGLGASGQGLAENPVTSPQPLAPSPFNVLDGVAALVDHSLVQRGTGPDGEIRFEMLETVREFAAERLGASYEGDGVRRRHASYFLELAEQAASHRWGPQEMVWFDRLEAEHPNLRAALAWASEKSQDETMTRLAVALTHFWFVRGYSTEGRGWLERALNLSRPNPVRSVTYGPTLDGAGLLAWAQGDYARAEALHEEALLVAQASGNPHGQAVAFYGLGDVARRQGRDDAAARYFEDALALFRTLEDPGWIAMALNGLGFATGRQGQFRRATALLDEAAKLFRQIGWEWGLAEALVYASYVARDHGDAMGAAALMRQSAALYAKHGDWSHVANALEQLAVIAGQGGRSEPAARLFGAAEALREAVGVALPPVDLAVRERVMTLVRAALGDADFVAAWREGRALSPEQALAEALARTSEVPSPDQPPSLDAAPPGPRLTRREREVLRLLAQGRTTQEIANQLYLSPRTVLTHVAHILGKLEVDTRTAAIAAAYQRNLL